VQAHVAVDADKRVSLGAAQMDGLARLAIAQAGGGGMSHGMALPISSEITEFRSTDRTSSTAASISASLI